LILVQDVSILNNPILNSLLGALNRRGTRTVRASAILNSQLISLAFRAIVGTSTAEPDFLDRGLANSTRLFGTIVNPRHAPVIAVGALDIEIIAKGGAALVDRGLQDVYDGLTQ
jgi:hypothetical protein